MTSTSWILIIILILLSIFLIYKQIEDFTLQDDPMIDELKKELEPLKNIENFRGKNLKEIIDNLKIYKGDKSYTINKEKIFLCLKDEKNNYYNKNILMYVLAHEISHVLSESVGHTDEFHDIFQDLLAKITDLGLYNPSIPIDKNYCNY
jgi:hypothetical protein